MTLFRSVNSAQKPTSNRIKKIKEGKIIGFKLLEILIFMYRAKLRIYTNWSRKQKKKKKLQSSTENNHKKIYSSCVTTRESHFSHTPLAIFQSRVSQQKLTKVNHFFKILL